MTTKTFKTNTARKSIIAGLACALAVTGILVAGSPRPALANDGSEQAQGTLAQQQSADHYEGEKVTIGDDWGQPVYAEWHKGSSGKWWATFWTYNWTKVWAEPAPAGCGWAFHVYDKDGNFVCVYRCEESSTHGEYGPQGVSSHWQANDGTWY